MRLSDRHIGYAVTKVFFDAKMIEGSSIHEQEVKMLSLVEKLKDLKVDLKIETYINVILQSLPSFFDPFIVNYSMNGLEKDLHEFINMFVQYKPTIEKYASSVLVREVSTLETKGKGAGQWRRKKGKTKSAIPSTQSAPVAQLGIGKGKRKAVQQSWVPKDVCINCREKGQ
ncbi:UNVERIFIED_CONTAM: hypothetical protein Sindi_0057200 [Sesamum indicum]